MAEDILARSRGKGAHRQRPSKARGSPRSKEPALPKQSSSDNLQVWAHLARPDLRGRPRRTVRWEPLQQGLAHPGQRENPSGSLPT